MATEKDLKKLSRMELVEILCRQREMLDELTEQNSRLEKRLNEAERRCVRYENRQREEAESRAADDELRAQLRRLVGQIDCVSGAAIPRSEAEDHSQEEARKPAEELLSWAQEEAQRRLEEADAEIARRRDAFTKQCEELLRGHEVLRRLMEN